MAKIYTTSKVEWVKGALNDEWPYAIQRDGRGGLYTRRTQPYQGGMDRSHWDLLYNIARMCGKKTVYFREIEVTVDELAEALSEMLDCHILPMQVLKWTGKKVLNAGEFLALHAWLKERGIG